MVVHDLRCVACGVIEHDHVFTSGHDVEFPTFCRCGSRRDIYYARDAARCLGGTRSGAGWHDREKVVVWESPTGEFAHPPRNDIPMPKRYRDRGYVRREITSLPEVRSFEKQTGRTCETFSWDRNGKADRPDPVPSVPEIPYCNLLE